MSKALLQQLVAANPAALCGLVFVAGCTGIVGGTPGGSGSSTSIVGAGASAGASASGGGAGSAGAGPVNPVVSTDPNTIVDNPPAFAPAPGLLRRLTRTQFRNAMSDVFGYAVDVNQIDTDSWDQNFAAVGAAVVITSDKGAEQYNTAVESAVDAVFSDATKRSQFIGCTPTGKGTDACLRGYVQKLGQRAWRRPLTSAELDGLGTLAASAATTLNSPVEGARWATAELFESPNFLYRPELGAPAANGALRFNGYELAGRLSFLIWNSVPDQTLLDQAASGALATTDGIRTEVTRMLATPAGRESVGNFAEEYMRLDRLATQAKDPVQFPEYNASLQTAMLRDVRDTWASIVFDDQASVMNLFTTTKVVVNSDLAALYGLPTTGLTPTTYKTLTLAADGNRSGLLSKPGLLSEFANQQAGSPTLRGKFIREALTCQAVPPPPAGVNLAAADQPTSVPMTKRQRLEAHRAAPGCAACHALMDPLGLPLESFDAIGKYRTMDNGLPVDPTSTFDGHAIADSRALGAAASQSMTVAKCLVRKYYSYAVGYPERDVDGSVLNTLEATFNASGFKMRDLIVAVVTNDAFSAVAPQP
ncbi:MAG: DUF1592 domain-containing protein [Pseudomonadota bacterium]